MRNQSVKEYFADLSPTAATDYSLWKATKKSKQFQITFSPVRQQDNNWARSNTEKVNAFAKHLASVFYPIPSKISQEEENVLIRTLEESYQLESPLEKVTKREVINIIRKNTDPKKAPEYDLITGKILKNIRREIGRYEPSAVNSAHKCLRIFTLFNVRFGSNLDHLQHM